MKCIIGRKIEMTRVFDEQGNATPVTVIATGTQTVTQVRTPHKDGVASVQVGTTGGSKRVRTAQKGHLKGINAQVTVMRDVRMADAEKFQRGDSWNCDVFEKGDKVTVTGTAKGRGFQGVVKRHGFHGSPKSHGHKDQLRMPGSIGSQRQGPVAKGKRMGGHMGANQVSVHNIKVVDIKPEEGLLYVKGAIPGARGSLVLVKGVGEMEIKKAEVLKPKDEEVMETPVTPEQENMASVVESEVQEKVPEVQPEAAEVTDTQKETPDTSSQEQTKETDAKG